MGKILAPTILETKEELLLALKSGQLTTSKYNLLDEKEKLFVELVAFGNYTATQAIQVIDPACKQATAAGNRMLGNPVVGEVLEELTVQRDKKFMTELVGTARDIALSKLMFIMKTTKDDALAAACAKTILDKGEKSIERVTSKEDPVTHISFSIKAENVYAGGGPGPVKEDPVILTITDEDETRILRERQHELGLLDEQIAQHQEELKASRIKTGTLPVDPATGLPYAIFYEGVNAYKKKD